MFLALLANQRRNSAQKDESRGRQSARTIHFLAASGLVLFGVVHIAMVLVSGAWNNLRSMITGRYVVRTAGDTHA